MTRLARAPVPDLALGAVVGLLGVFEALAFTGPSEQARLWPVFLAVGLGAAVALCRIAPAAAVAVLWTVFGVQLANDVPILLIEVAAAAVAFGAARWGRNLTLWISGVSIPLSAVIVLVYLKLRGTDALLELAGYHDVLTAARALGKSLGVVVGTFVACVLALPWLAGIGLRYRARARAAATMQIVAEQDAARAVQETEQVREIAQLREQQAQLARDVHDVVGHSLAVILAQAESAQYRPDTDSAALKETMANIATSARASLQEVRQVLTTTSQRPGQLRLGELDTLVDGLRASGHEVTSTQDGMVRPLPPELEVVAFRVLQEMITNVIKHGRRGTAVTVTRRWREELQLEVCNVIGTGTGDLTDDRDGENRPIAGHGLAGMRRRLESVGGRLETHRGDGAAGASFTVTAWLPLRAVAR